MKKQITIIVWTIVMFILISIAISIHLFKDNDDMATMDLNTKIACEYEGEQIINFVCLSYDEFVNKLKFGDVRSINQEETDEWELKAKELFLDWYTRGKIPNILNIDEYKMKSFKFADNMLGISFTEKEGCESNYYEVITLTDEISDNSLDIEEYYTNQFIYQDEILKSIGGKYEIIFVNDQKIKAAVTDYDDDTRSIDFIWNDCYWVRMWDNSTKIDNILENFELSELSITMPSGFKNDDYEAKVCELLKENTKITFLDKVNNSMLTYLNNLEKLQKSNLEDIFINEIPVVSLNTYLEHNLKLEYVDLDDETEITYLQYHYNKPDSDTNITISISPNIYLENNVNEYIDLYIKKFNQSNPFRFDQELVNKYGIFQVTSEDNINYYVVDNIYVGNRADVGIFYCNTGYKYSEYIVLIDNRFIKLSCNEENKVELLKTLLEGITISKLEYRF